MPTLRVFNPEHDLALAFGGTNYTPPPMARLLRRDLQLLPAWIGASGDSVLSQDAQADADWIAELDTLYGLGVGVVDVTDVGRYDDIKPWGWDRYVARRLFLDGARKEAMPSDDDIERLRNLSHRRISVEIHKLFREAIPSLQDNVPYEAFDLEAARSFARTNPKAYVKAPWSSSGKGVYRALDIDALDFNRWCSGIIKRQGSIMCEKPLNGVLDFAMEFSCENGKTQFVGYSIFNNDTHCSFSSGLIGSTQFLENKIVWALGDSAVLQEVKNVAVMILDRLIAPYYSGFAGIDMLVYADEENEMRINPCIELNLRTTMGVVTSVIGQRFLAEGSVGSFHVEFHKEAISVDYAEDLKAKYPLELVGKKIKSGVQFMTPLYKGSQYCCYVKADCVL